MGFIKWVLLIGVRREVFWSCLNSLVFSVSFYSFFNGLYNLRRKIENEYANLCQTQSESRSYVKQEMRTNGAA